MTITAQRRRIDAEMLKSLSTSFKMKASGYSFMHSFNDVDVSEMLERASHIVQPKHLAALKGQQHDK